MRAVAASLLIVAVTGSLLVAGAARRRTSRRRSTSTRASGYRITIPETWQVVPPSLAAVKQTIARLKKQKKTELAAVYSTYISTAARPQGAHDVPLPRLQVAAAAEPGADGRHAEHPADREEVQGRRPARRSAPSFAKNLRRPGAKIGKPQMLKLPAGRAALITGTVPLPKEFQGAKTGFSLILMLRPGKLYLLSFRIDSRAAADAKIFTSIADLFRFV